MQDRAVIEARLKSLNEFRSQLSLMQIHCVVLGNSLHHDRITDRQLYANTVKWLNLAYSGLAELILRYQEDLDASR